MKKHLMFMLVLLAATLSLCGCAEKQPTEHGSVPANMVCVRTDGYHEGVQYPQHTVIVSRAQLAAYYEANKGLYNLDSRQDGNSFVKTAEGYSSEYFQDKILLIVLLEENSGSVHYTLGGVSAAGTQVIVSINRSVPEIGTCDMAQWHVFVELPAQYAQSSFSVVLE